MKRSERRHHYRRIKRKRIRDWKQIGIELDDREAGIYARTACRCSCECCGNPRKHYNEPTFQEKKVNSCIR